MLYLVGISSRVATTPEGRAHVTETVLKVVPSKALGDRQAYSVETPGRSATYPAATVVEAITMHVGPDWYPRWVRPLVPGADLMVAPS